MEYAPSPDPALLDAAAAALAHDPVLADALAALHQENARLRQALAFYAEPGQWAQDYLGGGFTDSRAQEDAGEKTRTALNLPA